MSVDDALAQYAEFGNSVFGKARWWHERSKLWYPRAKYPSRKVRAAIQRIIFERLRDANPEVDLDNAIREPFKYREDRTRTYVSTTPAVIPPNNLLTINRRMVFSFCIDKMRGIDRPHLWRTYDNLHGTNTLNGSEAHTEEIWKVARATSAAPRFFESIKMGLAKQKHLDGGMCANNPSLKAFWEIRKLHGQTPAFFLSIGTGKKSLNESTSESRIRLRDYDKATKTDDVRRKQFIKKYLEIGSHWKDFMTDTEGDNGVQGWENIGELQRMPRQRFNVEGDLARIPLDDWRPISTGETTLEAIRTATEAYLAEENQVRRIAETARALVEIRRQRAMTERWETFAIDVTYQCPGTECLVIRYKTRDEFRKHVVNHNHHKGLKEDEVEDFLDSGRRYGRDAGS